MRIVATFCGNSFSFGLECEVEKGIEFVSGIWAKEMSETQKNRLLKSWGWHYYRTVGSICGTVWDLFLNTSRKLLMSIYIQYMIQSIATSESFGVKGPQFCKHVSDYPTGFYHFLRKAK